MFGLKCEHSQISYLRCNCNCIILLCTLVLLMNNRAIKTTKNTLHTKILLSATLGYMTLTCLQDESVMYAANSTMHQNISCSQNAHGGLHRTFFTAWFRNFVVAYSLACSMAAYGGSLGVYLAQYIRLSIINIYHR